MQSIIKHRSSSCLISLAVTSDFESWSASELNLSDLMISNLKDVVNGMVVLLESNDDQIDLPLNQIEDKPFLVISKATNGSSFTISTLCRSKATAKFAHVDLGLTSDDKVWQFSHPFDLCEAPMASRIVNVSGYEVNPYLFV